MPPGGDAEGAMVSRETDEDLQSAPADALARARAAARARGLRPGVKRKRRFKDLPGGGGEGRRGGRDPQTLGNVLGQVSARRGWQKRISLSTVLQGWAELVGADNAEHSKPVLFDDGVLTIECDSTAWATQLKLLAPTIVKRLNEELGDGTVTAIEILGPHLPNWKKGRFTSRDGRGPRDTYG